MRIHRLHIEAIGPFPGSHDVDFDELSAGGLFLLEGPTGAGKSTLIDAITFGLYGTLGKDLDTRLPSAHAPMQEPVVEVVFSTSAGIHRTRRTPAWQRPKKRGEGFTAQNSTARLWRLSSVDDAVGEPLASGAQEVGTEIQRLIQLTRDQFMQTVVLPQGRFSTFLRAKPDERAEVLRDVFGTAIYQSVQDQLREMATRAKREITSAQAEVSSAVRAFTNLLPDEDPRIVHLLEAGAALDEAEMRRIAAESVGAMQQDCETAAEVLRVTQEQECFARGFLDSQKDLERNLDRRVALLTEHRVLRDHGEPIRSHRERLAVGQRAATTSGALRVHMAAASVAETTRRTLAVLHRELEETVDHDLTGVTLAQRLRGIIDAASEERGELTTMATLEKELPARVQILVHDETRVAQAVSALEGERQALASRPAVRQQLVAAVEELRREATPVAVAEQVAEQRRQACDAARHAQDLAAELVKAETVLTEAAARATATSEREGALRLRWINSTAGTLAKELADGEPCPVCGGTQHPHPAPELPDHATLENVDEATGICREAVAALQEAQSQRIRIAERLEAQQEASDGIGLVDAQAALSAARDEVAEARNAVHLIDVAQKAVVSFDVATDSERLRVAAGETAAAASVERLTSDRTRLAADQERCRLAAGRFSSVVARVEKLDARLRRARKLIVTRQAHDDAEHRLLDARTARDESLSDAGFADAEGARAALLDARDRAHLEQLVQKYDGDLSRVLSGLAEDAVASLTGDEKVDVPAARAAHEGHRLAASEASSSQGAAVAILQRCQRAEHTISAVLKGHRTLTEKAAPVVRMGELTNAGEGNLRSTTLSTFVLLQRFEEVVAAANDRLTVMSSGRFSLLRTDEREGRARRAGLGLVVRDHDTETNRDPHTLSGGETFYVSLCLALGLADVVTSEAGGISLETLFIDEGFGSLDSDTLDGVLGELSRLQAGGRSVGIVSHVAELKSRIPERVEITRRPSGGSTLLVRA